MPEPSAPRAELPAAIQDCLTTTEVAQLLQLTPDTIRVWIVHGRLRAHNVGTKKCPRYLVPRSAIEEVFGPVDVAPDPKQR